MKVINFGIEVLNTRYTKNKVIHILTICICGCLSLFGQIDTITMEFQEYAESLAIAGFLHALDAFNLT